jgi:hypothetical protein
MGTTQKVRCATIGEQYVLPDQPRAIQTNSTKDTDKERRQAALVVGTSSLGLGRHELEVRLRITPTNSTIVAHRTFWVVPIWAWIVLPLLVLVLLAGVAWATVRALRHLRTREADAATPVPADPHAGAYDGVLGIEPTADVAERTGDIDEHDIDEGSDEFAADESSDDADFESND